MGSVSPYRILRGLHSLKRSVLILGALLVPWTARARVTRIVIAEKTTDAWAFEGKSFGTIGTYRRIQGLAYGELKPEDVHNRIIQDLILAPRNERGDAEYLESFTLYIPADLSKWSGILVYEIVNRGASILPDDFKSGDAFLVSGWQGDIHFQGKSIYGVPAETIRVPVAQSPDGTHITGPVLARFVNIAPGLNTLPIRAAQGYASSGAAPLPSDLDTAHAQLTARSFESVYGFSSHLKVIPSSDWRWADCTRLPFPGKADPAHICMSQEFDPDLLYELTYTAKDPLILGVGLAVIRDTAAFFRYSTTDDVGWRNPLAGRPIHLIVRGASQAGNTLRTFLNLGFNEDEGGRIVFDGAMSIIATRQNPINFRFAIPGGATTIQELGSEGTLWWQHWPDQERGLPASGLLDRCRLSHTCPRIIELLGSSEFWALRASPDFVGTSNDHDIPLPPEVRRYYVASTQHGGGAGGFHLEPAPIAGARIPSTDDPIVSMPCVLPPNPNPMKEIERALLADLEGWVVHGEAPPASVFPTLAAGTLVPATTAAMHFPTAPQLPRPDNIANPLLVYDLGEEFRYNDLSGVISNRPAPIRKVVASLVLATDSDGNEIGGIHTVLQQAALGTYLGWNTTASGFLKGQFCSLSGSYIPFARTKAERLRNFDPRPSLAERYGTQRGYACVAKRAANRLVSERLLLPEDAAAIVSEAEASGVLPGDAASGAEERRRAHFVCSRDTSNTH